MTKKTEKWNLFPRKYKLRALGGIAAGVGCFAMGVAALGINPVLTVAGVALAAGLGVSAHLSVSTIPFLRNRSKARALEDNEISSGPISTRQPVTKSATAFTKAFGMKPVEVYAGDTEDVASAVYGTNAVLFNEDILKQMKAKERDFLLGHEISHVHSRVNAAVQDCLVKKSTFGVGALCLLGAFTAMANPALGTAAACEIGAAVVGGSVGLKLAFGYAQHMEEYRADRNGLYFCDDFQAAAGVLKKLDALAPNHNRLRALFGTHPTCKQRIASLRRAWEKVRVNRGTAPQFIRIGNQVHAR